MNHIDKLHWRYAVKKFDSKRKLTEEQVAQLSQALRLTASAFGLQPWKFLIISDGEIKEKLLPASYNQRQVVEASHLVVFCAPLNFGASHVREYILEVAKTRGVEESSLEGFQKVMLNFLEAKDDADVHSWMKNQIYIALGSFLVSCAELGIDSCAMEGINPKQYDDILKLGEKGLATVVACPVGFRSQEDKYASLAKVRFPLERVIEYL